MGRTGLRGPGADAVIAAGWCAPSELVYEWFNVIEPERWPRGLTDSDLQWIATMLWLGGIDIADSHYLDLPSISIRRGGVRWPVTA